MFDVNQDLINECIDDEALIFKMIALGHYDIIEKLNDMKKLNVNIVDNLGNDVITRLLKAKQYDLVIQLMKKKNWDVNHKNVEGNTFGHILAMDNSFFAVKVVEELSKKKNYSPNIKNNKGETIFDKALNNNYLCTAMKILEDKRFNSIDFSSFRNLFNTIFNSKDYGKYTRINSLELIVDSLVKKDLDSNISKIIEEIADNFDVFKRDILNNDSKLLYKLVNNYE